MGNSNRTPRGLSRLLASSLAAALLLLAGGCGLTDSSSGVPPAPTIVKIGCLADGQVLVDGEPSNIQELAARLSLLTGTNAQVFYYREGADQEPHPNAMSVVKLVMDSKLPVSLSTRPDFADYVDADGQSHPRPVAR